MKQFLLLIFLLPLTVKAQNYETLPKGVRMFFSRTVKSDVDSSYNKSASETPYKYQINADIEDLRQVDDEDLQAVLDLIEPYPDAYNLISLGRYKLDASAEIDVNAYAFGYGITNRLTAYIGIPIYDARVKLKYRQTKQSTEQEVADALQKQYGDDFAQTIGQVAEQIYAVDAGIIQSAFVSNFGYQELGDWEGTGLGDIEFGLFYNFVKEYDYGLYTRVGGLAPTGYVDDPDIVQDIGFGDGQWDGYIELGGAYKVLNNLFLEAESRYTYQFASEQRLRVPISDDIPLSTETALFEEKLGNRVDSVLRASYIVNDWLTLQPSMLFSYTSKANYQSDNALANEILARNTDASSRSIRLDARLASMNLFMQGKFPLPVQLTFSAQKMVQGRNTAKTDLVEFEFRMFF